MQTELPILLAAVGLVDQVGLLLEWVLLIPLTTHPQIKPLNL